MMRATSRADRGRPRDALDIEQAVPQIAAHNGPVYMRLLRGNVRWCWTSMTTAF